MSHRTETIIRRATPVDAEDAIVLIEEYYEAVQVIARDDRAGILRHLSDPGCGIWLAYQGSIPAGCILYHPLPHLGPHAGEIKRLYVRPEFRRQGLAEKLLDTLERFAASRGARDLYLDSTAYLHVAIAFYQRSGYVPCDRYNDNPQATIFMRKSLAV